MARKFQNLQTQKFHDKSNSARLEGETKVDGAASQERGETNHESVVAEHGPAHTLHIEHDHDAKHSHVHSVHQSGHEHDGHFDGESHVKDAHKHAAKMAGSEEHEQLEDEAASKLEEAGHGDGARESYKMPGLD